MNTQTYMEDPMKKVTYINTFIPSNLPKDTTPDPVGEFFEWYANEEEYRRNKQMDKVIAEYYS